MKLIYNLGKQNSEWNSSGKDNAFLSLTNRKGGFSLFSNEPVSRYLGWFVTNEKFELFKVLENIEPVDASKVTAIKNELGSASRERKGLKEQFIIPAQYNSLIYKPNKKQEVDITLDIKRGFDNPEFGRLYTFYKEKGCLIVEFEQENDFKFYLIVKAESYQYTEKDEWIKRNYTMDEERNSPPYERYVYKPFSISANYIVFSAGADKNRVIEEAKSVFNSKIKFENKAKEREREMLNRFPSIISEKENINTAFISAKKSLNQLINYTGSLIELRFRFYAGLPWFFQFWSRDNFISLKAVRGESFLKLSQIKVMIFDTLKAVDKRGSLPLFLPSIKQNENTPQSGGETSDALGWLYVRINEMLSNGDFHLLERSELKRYTKHIIKKLLYYQTLNGFAHSAPHSTWMDSLERAGATIEEQALRLNLYNTAYRLTGNSSYAALEERLRESVKKHFWNGEILFDTKEDATIRPNIFLAAYIYPPLLSKEEWVTCFENTLPKLWLKWGGLTSIDKKNPNFVGEHTGEDNTSYHQGDSWFFLNNLAALVLYRTDKDKFSKHIEKIAEASTKEITKQGAIGAHAEVSSASKLRSQGCLNQAWSNAMYIELMRELYR